MELKSMVDFVLSQKRPVAGSDLGEADYYYQEYAVLETIVRYANFLKQPLDLSMFVPCADDGEVLEEPQPIYHKDSFDDCEDYDYDQTECDAYRKAKERCLFEGLGCTKANDFYFIEKGKMSVFVLGLDKLKTIEDLIPYNLTLTQTAINQITTRR